MSVFGGLSFGEKINLIKNSEHKLRIKCKKTLLTIIGEHQSEAIKNITLLCTLSTICVIIDESNKLNKNLSVIS